jgi:hypothetical protein
MDLERSQRRHTIPDVHHKVTGFPQYGPVQLPQGRIVLDDKHGQTGDSGGHGFIVFVINPSAISAVALLPTEACALLQRYSVLVRLTKKFAERIDDVDLTRNAVGNLIDLPDEKAQLLIAEGWAMEERRLPFGGRRDVVAFRRAGDPGPLRIDRDDASRAS